MANYDTGSVNLTVGSSSVVGNSTDFTTYVSNGDLFRVSGETPFYSVADVVTATQLTLTGRYADSSQYSSIASNIASTTTATSYSFTLTKNPIIQNSVVVTASERFTDNGAGILSGSKSGTGTVGYDDGAVSIILGTQLTATYTVAASYNQGNTRNALSYQVVTDYTTNYSFPEIGLNDAGLPAIYTKAIRDIDKTLNNLEQVRAVSFTIKGNAVLDTNALSVMIPSDTVCNNIKADCDASPAGAALIIDVNKNGVSMLNSTRLVVAAGDTTGSIVPTITSIASWDVISLDIDQIGSDRSGGDDLRVAMKLTAA